MNKLSTAQLSKYLAVTKRTVQRRAIRESWLYTEQEGLGGIRRMFVFESLPAEVKKKVISHIVVKHECLGLDFSQQQAVSAQDVMQNPRQLNFKPNPFIVPDKAIEGDWLSQHCFAHRLDSAELNKDYVKAGLLVLARLYVMSFSLGKIKGFDQFCRLYNLRELALNEAIYGVVGRVSRITLLRWENSYREKEQVFNGNDSNIESVDNQAILD